MHTFIAAAVLAGSLGGATLVQAQPKSPTPPASALTAADYAAIYQLYARYAFSLDKVVDNGQMWASLFTPDGVFVDKDGTTVSGRVNLAKFAWDKATRGPFRLITYISSVMIEPSVDGATASAYYLTMNVGVGQQPMSLVPGGIFFDTLVKTGDGWRFKHKTLVAPDGTAPQPAASASKATVPAATALRSLPRATAPLTAQDFADIEQLSARYAFGNDSGADNGYMLASAFTADGFFASTVTQQLRGPEQLAAAGMQASAGMGPYNTHHWTWNMLVDPAPWGGASGRAYVEVTFAKGPGLQGTLDNGGSYLDTYAKTADGWRFTQRHPVLDWRRPPPPAATPAPAAAQGELNLKGAIDFHAHSDPDSGKHSIDADDLVRLAKDAGMRGIVLKSHYLSTATLAYMARKAVPGIEVFGGMTMDLANGGINIEGVRRMSTVTGGYGRVVWLPTINDEKDWRQLGSHGDYVPLSKDGKLLPNVLELIDFIAQHHELVLETGHATPEEGLQVIREARARGVTHVLVTHAMNEIVGMTIPQMQQAAKDGAFLEFTYDGVSGPKPMHTMKEYVEAIRAVGPQWCVLSTNYGGNYNPPRPFHPQALLDFMTALNKEGISVADVNTMAKTNPALLLGLKP